MSQRHNYNPTLGVLDTDLVLADGYFRVDAVGDIVSGTNTILGVTPSHSGTGEYTFTFDDPFQVCQYADLVPVLATAKDLQCQIKSWTKTVIVIRLLAGATPTDPNAAGGMFFLAMVRHSRLTR